MTRVLEQCENWLSRQYKSVLGMNLVGDDVRLRWLSKDSIMNEVLKADAHGLAIEDEGVGWILFLLPYENKRLEIQVNQALGLRSKLLREANYSGSMQVADKEDKYGSWRIALLWLVEESDWDNWQHQILELRRESGAAEEISFDAVQIIRNDIVAALEKHGLPRLLLHTRALLTQTAKEAEKWLSANIQVLTELKDFSQQFATPRARTFAREMEEKARNFQPEESIQISSELREFRRFRVKHFRNIDDLEIAADPVDDAKAQAIIIFGPNGTGKSSFAEALSLATFGTSPRLEQFLSDDDLPRVTAETYLKDYLSRLVPFGNSKPCFTWGKEGEYEETSFVLNTDETNKRRFEGVVLNQEDYREFTDLTREELAARVLKGYSTLAEKLLDWLAQEEKSAKETKNTFTRKHGINSAISRSATAYNRLAQTILNEQLQRPSAEFLAWLRFLERLSVEDGRYASKLISDWTSQQDTAIERLADTISKVREKGASALEISREIRVTLDVFDRLAKQSDDLRRRLETQIGTLRERLDSALSQIETWGVWLSSQTTTPTGPETDAQSLKNEIDSLAKKRTVLEKSGKTLRGRLELLDQAKQFLVTHWAAEHPDTCPVCNSNLSAQQGIEVVVSTLQQETNATIQDLRARHVEIQNLQRDLDAKLKAAGVSTCPLSPEDQKTLKELVVPFIPQGTSLEHYIIDSSHRNQLKDDLSRMKVIPEAPKPYTDAIRMADGIASDFMTLTEEADRALEDPQAIGEVRKGFEQRLEKVLKDHLPATLGTVWQEITLSLTTAAWLLPARPNLKLEQRGKSLSVQADDSGRYIRYIYNAAERHVLGLAWFFTYYLAKRRFEEAWMLLDDPAQEMDQPSFRELVRLFETLLRLHEKNKRPFTMIVALHQEERALDASRATNGRLYMLGWKKEQEDTSARPSVKRVVLLAPGFHPLKPEWMHS